MLVESFSIAITDVNEFAVSTPVDNNVAANTVAENAVTGTLVGITAHASDADATDNTVSYSQIGRAACRESINSSSGGVTVDEAIDREADGASPNITLQATSADAWRSDVCFSIPITDVNEFAVSTPVDTNVAANTVAENAVTGTLVGITAHASDADATDNTVSYS